MRRDLVVGTVAAVVTGGVLALIDRNDFSKEPATDNADVVATLAVVVGAVVWLGLRWMKPDSSGVQLARAIAAGVAVGAVVTSLASVVYDPFAANVI